MSEDSSITRTRGDKFTRPSLPNRWETTCVTDRLQIEPPILRPVVEGGTRVGREKPVRTNLNSGAERRNLSSVSTQSISYRCRHFMRQPPVHQNIAIQPGSAAPWEGARSIPLSEVLDGTSNTVLMGEMALMDKPFLAIGAEWIMGRVCGNRIVIVAAQCPMNMPFDSTLDATNLCYIENATSPATHCCGQCSRGWCPLAHV